MPRRAAQRDDRQDSFEDQQGARRRLTAASAYEDIDDSYGTPYTEEDLFGSGGGESDDEGDRRRANWGFRHRARDAAEGAREMGEQLSEKASEVGHGISDAAARATGTVGDAVSSAGERTSSLGRDASRTGGAARAQDLSFRRPGAQSGPRLRRGAAADRRRAWLGGRRHHRRRDPSRPRRNPS